MVRGQSLAAEKFSASTGLGDIEAVLRGTGKFRGSVTFKQVRMGIVRHTNSVKYSLKMFIFFRSE